MRSVLPICLLFCACAPDKPSTPVVVPPTSTQAFDYVRFGNDYDYPNVYIDALDAWIHQHPGKRVVAVAGIPKYRRGLQGCVIHHRDGSGQRQHFVQLPDALGPELTDRLTPLQEFSDKYTIITLTGIPAYSGGVTGYLVCVEDKPEQSSQ